LSLRWLFALVGVLAAFAGTALWLATRNAPPPAMAQAAAPAALFAATFKDLEGRARSLGEFQGRVVVLNFWATWCAPCREEMPSFERLQGRWKKRGAVFVGISSEQAPKVVAFSRSLGLTYPLWIGGDEVGELSRRLGNSAGVLPHTVVLDASGRVVDSRVGVYPEAQLERTLTLISSNAPPS
jgi:thiol-disulfide isomerase/thioredoxin